MKMYDIDFDIGDLPYHCPKCGSIHSSLKLLRQHLELQHCLRSHHKSTEHSRPPARLHIFNKPAKELERQLRLAKDTESRHMKLFQNQVQKSSDEIQQLSDELKNSKLQQQQMTNILKQTQQQVHDLRKSADKISNQQQQLVDKLQEQLKQKDDQLEKSSRELCDLINDRCQLQNQVAELNRGVETNISGQFSQLQQQISEKEEQIRAKQREVQELQDFVKETCEQENAARARLEEFIGSLLDRAQKAETQVAALKQQMVSPPTMSVGSNQAPRGQSIPAASMTLPVQSNNHTHPMDNLHGTPNRVDDFPGVGQRLPFYDSPISPDFSTREILSSFDELEKDISLPLDENGIIWNVNYVSRQPADRRRYNPSLSSPGYGLTKPTLRPQNRNRPETPYASLSESGSDTGYSTRRINSTASSDLGLRIPMSRAKPDLGRLSSINSDDQALISELSEDTGLELKRHKARLREHLEALRRQDNVLKPFSRKSSNCSSQDGYLTSVTNDSNVSSMSCSSGSESDYKVKPYTTASDFLKRNRSSLVATESSRNSSGSLKPPVYRSSSRSNSYSPADGKLSELEQEQRRLRRDALFCVFMYLDVTALGQVAQVCKEWRTLSQHPALWRKVSLRNTRLSSKYLQTISQWCTQLQSLTLQGVTGRVRRKGESLTDYELDVRGSLEPGLELLLQASHKSLLSLRVSNCGTLLTDRCLWLASCHSRFIQRVVYISESDPAGSEVIWALGAGCREITTLIVPPLSPNQHPEKFNNRVVHMIGRCWPHLQVLCVGGQQVDIQGLTSIARLCQRLQVLELDNMGLVGEAGAIAMCDVGLKGLQTLDFSCTPVTPEAVKHFIAACPHLQSVKVHIARDYAKNAHGATGDIIDPGSLMQALRHLKHQPGISGILSLTTDHY